VSLDTTLVSKTRKKKSSKVELEELNSQNIMFKSLRDTLDTDSAIRLKSLLWIDGSM